MSKHNREKRALWQLKLHRRFLGCKLVGKELDVALRAAKKGMGIKVSKNRDKPEYSIREPFLPGS